MKNIISFKLFENEKNDSIQREKAIIFFNKLQKVLKHQPNILKPTLDSYYIEGKIIDRKYDDLFIVFLHKDDPRLHISPNKMKYDKNEYKITGGYNRKKGISVIFCINLIEPKNKKYIDTRLDRTNFIHEFIHYLDDKKSKSVSGLKFKNIKDYYNSPHEYNAYYQQDVDILKKVIKNHPEEKNKINNFHEFKEYALKFFDKQWYKLMNDKYRKKLDKRLYNLYTDLFNI